MGLFKKALIVRSSFLHPVSPHFNLLFLWYIVWTFSCDSCGTPSCAFFTTWVTLCARISFHPFIHSFSFLFSCGLFQPDKSSVWDGRGCLHNWIVFKNDRWTQVVGLNNSNFVICLIVSTFGEIMFLCRYEYLWKDGEKYKKPTQLSAPEYITLLIDWVECKINDEHCFPVDPCKGPRRGITRVIV